MYIDEGTKIKNKIRNAKDITRVFKNLQRAEYDVMTYPTKLFNEDYYRTDITSNNVNVNVLWRPHTEPSLSNGYKQEILLITY